MENLEIQTLRNEKEQLDERYWDLQDALGAVALQRADIMRQIQAAESEQ